MTDVALGMNNSALKIMEKTTEIAEQQQRLEAKQQEQAKMIAGIEGKSEQPTVLSACVHFILGLLLLKLLNDIVRK